MKYPVLHLLILNKGIQMKINNLPVAILAYVESILLPKIPSSLGKWMTYAGVMMKMPGMTKMIEQYIPMFKEFGAINENGDIDLAKLREIGISAFEKVPVIEIADFDFDQNDFEAFISYLSTQG